MPLLSVVITPHTVFSQLSPATVQVTLGLVSSLKLAGSRSPSVVWMPSWAS